MKSPLVKISVAVFLVAVFAFGYLMSTNNRLPEDPASQPAVVSMVPEFSLPDLDGKLQSISQWSGNTMIINFWATWCAPCRREMPLLQKIHAARNDSGVKIIGIAIDRRDDVEAFVAEVGVTYPILVGEDDAMSAADLFGAEFVALPFTAFVAPNGEILRLHLGEIHAKDIAKILAITDQVASGAMTTDQARKQLENF